MFHPKQRSMESVGGPDAKKARWSPTSFVSSNGVNNLSNGASARDAFANYGYGPQASISQPGYNNHSPSNAFAANHLYSTPSLSVNTATTGNGISSQMSPNAAGPFTSQIQQTPTSTNGNGYGGFGGYNMLAMGMQGMGVLNGFAYGNQMGNFNQVRHAHRTPMASNLLIPVSAGFQSATPRTADHPYAYGISLLTSYSLGCSECPGQRYGTNRLRREPPCHGLR